MSLLSLIEGFFSGGETELKTVEAGFATTDSFVGVVLGEAEAASGVLAAVDPTIGGPILAGVTALQTLQASVKASLTGASVNAAAVSQQVGLLSAKATELAVQIAPFFKAVANDAGTAVAAAQAQAAAASTAAAA